MAFLPIGPDFAFIPRDGNFKRLSRRNEAGAQGMVEQVYVDPTDPATIYVIARPGPAGWPTLFRSQDQGISWSSIADGLQKSEPQFVDVSSLAVNPVSTNIIYIGTYSGATYVSNDFGATWSARIAAGNNLMVRSLFVDARTAANAKTTVLYAATTKGIWRSQDGGSSWAQNWNGGDVLQVIGYTPQNGTAHFFATVFNVGLFHSTDPNNGWTNLNDGNILPARDNNFPFNYYAIDYCLDTQNAGKIRVYAMMNTWGSTLGIFTANDPTSPWTNQNAMNPPAPGQGSYTWGLAVAPNSLGDGATDVLFANNQHLVRSTDAGKSWTALGVFHDDYHSTKFFGRGKAPPLLYFGCDGGLGMSDNFADTAFAAPTDFDEGDIYSDLGVTQNLSHGLQNHGAIDVWSDPGAPALAYINCQDVGVIAGAGDLGWRSIDIVDAWAMTGALGMDGVKVFYYAAVPNWLKMITDKGQFGNAAVIVLLDTAQQNMVPTSNLQTDLGGQCLSGIWPRDPSPTLTADVTAGMARVVTPSSMQFIQNGTMLFIENESVTASKVTNTTFTADFANGHKGGMGIVLQRLFVVRVDQTGTARQISQDFNAQVGFGPSTVAFDPTNANNLYCATGPGRLFNADYEGGNQRVFMTIAGINANSQTVWTEVGGMNKPNNMNITSITVDNAGNVYVMLNRRLTVTYNMATFDTPLYQLTGNDWVPQPQAGLPAPTPSGFGPLRADPVQANTFYTSNGAKIHRLNLMNGSWNWTDISDGLPGAPIMDLSVVNIGTMNAPRVLLRAATSGRGAWERDVTANTVEPALFPFMRANFLDLRRLPACPNGIPNPYDPQNAAVHVFHYQSPDIKIDAAQLDKNGAAFFQTDPEAPFPLSHVHFTLLKDNSDNVPQADSAWVHVQVHNRGTGAANAVQVWTLYANASAGVPSLSASPMNGNKFDFWGQFWNNGQIVPNLPADSPWKAFGKPQLLAGITATSPKVASWSWTVPTLPNGDPGHYCVAAFIHSPASPLVETGTNFDDVTTHNPQTALKNVHFGPALSSGGGAGAGPAPRGSGPRPWMREYVEFHNPTGHRRTISLALDLRGLPPQLAVAFRLSPLKTKQPIGQSITGLSHEEPTQHHRAALPIDEVKPAGGSKRSKRDRDDDRERPHHHHVLAFRFAPELHRAAPSALVQVHGLELGPYEHGAMLLAVDNTGHLPAGHEYTFQVQQIIDERVVGGSVYSVRIAGRRLGSLLPMVKDPPPATPFDDALDDGWQPAWVRNIAAHYRSTRPSGAPDHG
jgi:photosystem II stability/assembly factor-like uncharacterized protein